MYPSNLSLFFALYVIKNIRLRIRAVTYVALHGKEGKKINLVELSENINVPHHFLGKIMQDLVKNNIVRSLKGPGGGFWADETTQNLSAFEILKVTDGKAILSHCLMEKRTATVVNHARYIMITPHAAILCSILFAIQALPLLQRKWRKAKFSSAKDISRC